MADAPARDPYTARLIAELGDRDPLAVLAELPLYLERQLCEVPYDLLRRPEAPGKWSLLQVVQHLTDSDLVYGYRIRMILIHDNQRLERYDRDSWAGKLRYHDAELDEALAELGSLRRRNLRLLRSLTAVELDRVGIHETRGPESIRTMISLLAGHDLVHRKQIERIRSAVATPESTG